MRSESTPGWLLALAQIPSTLYVLTASRKRATGAVLASWVQQVSFEPPLISVAIPRGRGVAPLIRDSRCFALNQIDPEDRLLPRRFRMADDRDWSALDAIPYDKLATGAPCIKRAMAVLDCQVLRHLDVEADHELYIGQVVGGRVSPDHRFTLKPDTRASGRIDLLPRMRLEELRARGINGCAPDAPGAPGGADHPADRPADNRINGAGNGHTPNYLRAEPLPDDFDDED